MFFRLKIYAYKNTRVHNMCTLICFMIPRAMPACTKYVTASYHVCSGAESGKTGEASKSAAVFTPVDNDILGFKAGILGYSISEMKAHKK